MLDFVNQKVVILLGQADKGKSATGNTLLGRKEFKLKNSREGSNSSTSNIEQATCSNIMSHYNIELTIIDTPGRFQSRNVAETALKLLQVKDMKPHVFVLVLRSDQFTEDEKYTADILKMVL
ncbi:hypothetical protein DPMN_145152 [Dreissena polymorpha]|uniref:AIG1-type G domain-containing protein n=1 Tax=Dreissena polymorpha TaxID=45954 RepID=A0A9D4F4E9_DREPO|nr:hypothetical protein DPMN_145152 [Dreissena polymorpha]